MGIKYMEEKVIFTLTDIGDGILKTLYRKHIEKLKETFTNNTKILRNAFDKNIVLNLKSQIEIKAYLR